MIILLLKKLNLNRSNAPALLARSGACDRLQLVQGALAPQGFSGSYNLPLKFLNVPRLLARRGTSALRLYF